jgi:hypothetical protein
VGTYSQIQVKDSLGKLSNSIMEPVWPLHSDLSLLVVRSANLTEQIVVPDPNGLFFPEPASNPVKKAVLSSYRPILVLGLLLPKLS